MGQGWLNQDPRTNRSLLQTSLFGDDEPAGIKTDVRAGLAPSHRKKNSQAAEALNTQKPLAGSFDEITPNQGNLVDELEAAIHGVDCAPVRRRRARSSAQSSTDGAEPDLHLDDETLLYFRKIGMRDLLAEMVLQSIRDCVHSCDQARMDKLKTQSPEEFDEMQYSAKWLATNEGHLAIQMLYPDWDHFTIVRRIYEDPKGVLARMSEAGMRRHQENADGFSESSLSDDSGFSDRLSTWSESDLIDDDCSYR